MWEWVVGCLEGDGRGCMYRSFLLRRDPEIRQVDSTAPPDLSGNKQGPLWLVSRFVMPEPSEL